MGPRTAVVLEGVPKAVHRVEHTLRKWPRTGLLGEELTEAGPSQLY